MQQEFYVHWALKESYVKAAGTGVGFGLQRISFVSSSKLMSDSR
jgi:phosphopantetheinyl transferase